MPKFDIKAWIYRGLVKKIRKFLEITELKKLNPEYVSIFLPLEKSNSKVKTMQESQIKIKK